MGFLASLIISERETLHITNVTEIPILYEPIYLYDNMKISAMWALLFYAEMVWAF